MKVFAVNKPGGSSTKTSKKSAEKPINANANRNRSGIARLTTPIGRGSASGNPLRKSK